MAYNVIDEERTDQHRLDGNQKKRFSEFPKGQENDRDIDDDRRKPDRNLKQIVCYDRKPVDAAWSEVCLHGKAHDTAAEKQGTQEKRPRKSRTR